MFARFACFCTCSITLLRYTLLRFRYVILFVRWSTRYVPLPRSPPQIYDTPHCVYVTVAVVRFVTFTVQLHCIPAVLFLIVVRCYPFVTAFLVPFPRCCCRVIPDYIIVVTVTPCWKMSYLQSLLLRYSTVFVGTFRPLHCCCDVVNCYYIAVLCHSDTTVIGIDTLHCC